MRYFDPLRQRAGVPEDVAALIHTMQDDTLSLTLVNVNQSQSRTVVVQTGGYAEHQCLSVTLGNKRTPVNAPWFRVRLLPGAGARLVLKTRRYANQPTLVFPWDRSWKIK